MSFTVVCREMATHNKRLTSNLSMHALAAPAGKRVRVLQFQPTFVNFG